MASSNHTTYFDLSQYTSNDKPTYLVDYNGDMSKIDAGLHEADSDAKTAISEIGELTNLTTTVKSSLVSAINEVDGETAQIGNLSNLTTTANTDLVSAINEVDAEADTNTTAIGTLANLETAVKTNLVGAVNEVNSNVGDLSNLDTTYKSNTVGAINEVINSLNVSVVKTYNTTAEVSGVNATISTVDVKIAKSSNEDIGKIYGNIGFSAGYSSVGINLANSGIDTDTSYAVDNIAFWKDTTDNKITDITGLGINTDGTLYAQSNNLVTGHNYTLTIIPVIIYFKSFGDSPVTPI